MNDRDKALDKIRKCLALSKSPNEHEAAAALRQAQKMMDRHGFSEEDVGLIEYTSCLVVTDYEWPNPTDRKTGARLPVRKVPFAVSSIVALIRDALGVRPVYEPSAKGHSFNFAVRYFGPRDRVMAAEYAHVVVTRALKGAWSRYKDENPFVVGMTGARAGFYLGWCETVSSKVSALVVGDEEAKKIDDVIRRFHGDDGVRKAEANGKKVRALTYDDGQDRGRDFDLNRPVGQNRMQIGRDK